MNYDSFEIKLMMFTAGIILKISKYLNKVALNIMIKIGEKIHA